MGQPKATVLYRDDSMMSNLMHPLTVAKMQVNVGVGLIGQTDDLMIVIKTVSQ